MSWRAVPCHSCILGDTTLCILLYRVVLRIFHSSIYLYYMWIFVSFYIKYKFFNIMYIILIQVVHRTSLYCSSQPIEGEGPYFNTCYLLAIHLLQWCAHKYTIVNILTNCVCFTLVEKFINIVEHISINCHYYKKNFYGMLKLSFYSPQEYCLLINLLNSIVLLINQI